MLILFPVTNTVHQVIPVADAPLFELNYRFHDCWLFTLKWSITQNAHSPSLASTDSLWWDLGPTSSKHDQVIRTRTGVDNNTEKMEFLERVTLLGSWVRLLRVAFSTLRQLSQHKKVIRLHLPHTDKMTSMVLKIIYSTQGTLHTPGLRTIWSTVNV